MRLNHCLFFLLPKFKKCGVVSDYELSSFYVVSVTHLLQVKPFFHANSIYVYEILRDFMTFISITLKKNTNKVSDNTLPPANSANKNANIDNKPNFILSSAAH